MSEKMLFEQTFVNTHARTSRPWTVAVSLALQTTLVAIAFLTSLLHIAALQRPDPVPVWLPPQTLKEQPQQPARTAARTAPPTRAIFTLAPLVAPARIPAHIEMVADAPELGNTTLAAPSGSSVFAGLPNTTIQPPVAAVVKPPAPTPAPISGPLRVSGGVQSAKLAFGPRPAYPPLARTARIQGTVRIQAIIGQDGAIRNLQVLAGPPLLINAAREAVQQWRYQPTLLNGEPVAVITEIDVNFLLGQ